MADVRRGARRGKPRRNAGVAWLVTLVLTVLAIGLGETGSYRWFAFTIAAVVIVLLPVLARRDPFAMPPWTLLALVLLPVGHATVLGESFLTTIETYVAVAAIALVAVVEIDRFTAVRMTHAFAITLVVLTTLAAAGAWNVTQWVADVTLGTDYVLTGRSEDAANRAMMIDFGYAAVAGLIAGVVFDRRFKTYSEPVSERSTTTEEPVPDSGAEPESDPIPLLRDRLDVPDEIVRRLARVMQVALAGILLYGLVTRDLPTIANAAIALAITSLPAVLERDAQLPLEPGLVFWLTAAVFLHGLGSAGFYGLIGQWDSLTHTMSASIVAAAGYAVVRAIDLHSDEVYFPPAMLFAFILVFVLAFGVVWELFEFGIDWSARVLGSQAVVSQHGLRDTIVDLVYDVVGAVVAAIWGTVYLTDLTHRIAGRLERESSG